jgi:hypothetical protein
MDWNQAKKNIANIKIGTHLDKSSNYRRVISVDENYFTVSIGKNTNIKIPWSTLKECFSQLINSGVYDSDYFQENFSTEYKKHTCYVHVIGQIFVAAGIAKRIDWKYAPK